MSHKNIHFCSSFFHCCRCFVVFLFMRNSYAQTQNLLPVLLSLSHISVLSLSFSPLDEGYMHTWHAFVFGFIITVIILYLVQTCLHLLSLSVQMLFVSPQIDCRSASCMHHLHFLTLFCRCGCLHFKWWCCKNKILFHRTNNSKTIKRESVRFLLLFEPFCTNNKFIRHVHFGHLSFTLKGLSSEVAHCTNYTFGTHCLGFVSVCRAVCTHALMRLQ